MHHATDAPPTAQLVVTRSAAKTEHGERAGKIRADQEGHWAVANEYNAIFGNQTVPGVIPILGGDVPGWNLCQDLCEKQAGCDIFAWSGVTKNCWGRLDGRWGGAATLHDDPDHISGCILGDVSGCDGRNPIPILRCRRPWPLPSRKDRAARR